MTDHEESEQPPDARELLSHVERHQAPDSALQGLVDMIDRLGDTLSLGVTVLVHGQIVAGQAVSGREFFEGLAQRVKVPVSGDNDMTDVVRGGLAERFEALRDTFPTFPRDDRDQPPPPLRETTYLHLKNAYMIVGGEQGTIPTNAGLWLRVRLSAVDGFSMESMTIS